MDGHPYDTRHKNEKTSFQQPRSQGMHRLLLSEDFFSGKPHPPMLTTPTD